MRIQSLKNLYAASSEADIVYSQDDKRSVDTNSERTEKETREWRMSEPMNPRSRSLIERTQATSFPLPVS